MDAGKSKRRSKRKLIGKVGELTHGTSKKFTLRRGDNNLEGILVNYGGDLFAYVNRCPHIGMSLDWVDNQFFTIDRRYLMCANHGATFEPATGQCIWGPCAGASLQSVPLEIEGPKIFARYPGRDEEA
jgi:nitrite reductase/ring-hydroxylating ferredoxin subunit